MGTSKKIMIYWVVTKNIQLQCCLFLGFVFVKIQEFSHYVPSYIDVKYCVVWCGVSDFRSLFMGVPHVKLRIVMIGILEDILENLPNGSTHVNISIRVFWHRSVRRWKPV